MKIASVLPIFEGLLNPKWCPQSTNPETVSQDARIHAYGPKFKYTEFMVMPGKLSSIMLSLGLALSIVCLMIPPVCRCAILCPCDVLTSFLGSQFRWLFTKLMPQSGEGPSERLVDSVPVRQL